MSVRGDHDAVLAAALRANVHPADVALIVPVRGAVFDRGTVVMAGTNVRVSDVVARFAAGDGLVELAADFEVEPAAVEAALRTALRAGRPDP